MSTSQNSVNAQVQNLYLEHHGWLLAWLHRRMGNPFDAADLSQDTWVRLLVSGRLPMPEQARMYLKQVAKGLAIDLHRRRVLEAEYLSALSLQPQALYPSPEEQLLVIESLLLIDKALAGLNTRVREVFLLSRFEGLTYSKIAAQMGVSEASVRKYMLKAVMACDAALQSAQTPDLEN